MSCNRGVSRSQAAANAAGCPELEATWALARQQATPPRQMVLLGCGHTLLTGSRQGEEWCPRCDGWQTISGEWAGSEDIDKRLRAPLGSGKYKGRSIAEVWNYDPDHIEWLARQRGETGILAGYVIRYGQTILKNTRLLYGSHSGNTLGQLYEEDPEAVASLSGNLLVDPSLSRAARMIICRTRGLDPLQHRLTEGKYAGKTLGEVYEQDRDYLKILAENMRRFQDSSNLLALINVVFQIKIEQRHAARER